jgi:hypothetical protein
VLQPGILHLITAPLIPSSSFTVTEQNPTSSSQSPFAFLSGPSTSTPDSHITTSDKQQNTFSSAGKLFRLVSVLFLVFAVGLRYFILGDPGGSIFTYPRRARPKPEPTSPWTSRTRPREIYSSGYCKVVPTYLPDFEMNNHTNEEAMALLDYKPLIDRAEAISKGFEYGADDVRKGVKEFLRLMGQ